VVLHDKVTQLSINFVRLVGEVSSLRSAAAEMQIDFTRLKTKTIEIPVSFESRIVSGFPVIFDEFQGKYLKFCVGAAVMVLAQKNFTTDATFIPTH
jgi:hypothetical protein